MAKSVEQARENLEQAKADMKNARDLRDAQKVDAENRAAKLKMNPKNMNYMRIKVTRTDKNDKADIVVGGNAGIFTIKPGKEVVIPDAELSAKARAESQQAARPATSAAPSAAGVAVASTRVAPAQVGPATGGRGGYLLQVGAWPEDGKAQAISSRRDGAWPAPAVQ